MGGKHNKYINISVIGTISVGCKFYEENRQSDGPDSVWVRTSLARSVREGSSEAMMFELRLEQ